MPLVLALIHETTIATSKSYYPNQKDVSNFLTILNTWWTIANFNKDFHLILLAMPIIMILLTGDAEVIGQNKNVNNLFINKKTNYYYIFFK